MALAETIAVDAKSLRFHVFRKLKPLANDDANLDWAIARDTEIQDLANGPVTLEVGDLVLLLGYAGDDEEDEGAWHILPASEVACRFVARLPVGAGKRTERLEYCGKFLEHADPFVADFAFREFAAAPFEDVRSVAKDWSMDQVRDWLASTQVADERKGLYALALGLTEDKAERERNLRFLIERMEAPGTDFRAGFDGVLGGYLLLSGVEGMDRIEAEYLRNAEAANGDIRHAFAAVRFAFDHSREIPQDRSRGAVRHLLARPEFAAEAVTTLARWKDWSSLASVSGMFEQSTPADPILDRAVIGYLLVCPTPDAAKTLTRLAKQAPEKVADAERYFGRVGIERDR